MQLMSYVWLKPLRIVTNDKHVSKVIVKGKRANIYIVSKTLQDSLHY